MTTTATQTPNTSDADNLVLAELLKRTPPTPKFTLGQLVFYPTYSEPLVVAGVRLEPGVAIDWLPADDPVDKQVFADVQPEEGGTDVLGAYWCDGAPQWEYNLVEVRLVKRWGTKAVEPFGWCKEAQVVKGMQEQAERVERAR